MDGMTNIGRGKLGWTASSGFLQLRLLLRTKSRDGRNMDTNSRGNGMGRLASIKLGKDIGLLSRRKRLHDGGGRKQRSVGTV